jgi:hypothetical protein
MGSPPPATPPKRWLTKARRTYLAAKSKLEPLLAGLNWLCILGSVFFIVVFLRHLPSAGIAIGFLGGVGVIVALVGDKNLTPSHKVIWAAITLCFLVIEVRAIKQDRKEQYDQFSGGDDFGFMVYKDALHTFSFVHQGEHVLFDVWARFVDLNKFSATTSWEEANKYNYHLGDFAQNSGTMIEPPVPFSDNKKQDFNIFFNARNGFWEQGLRLRFINGHWSVATRVSRRHAKGSDLLYEQIDPDFPRNASGGVDW